MNNVNHTYYFADISSEFQYGKYIGLPLYYIILRDKDYIYWTMNTISEFKISKEALRQIHLFFPRFIVPETLGPHIVERESSDANNVDVNFISKTD